MTRARGRKATTDGIKTEPVQPSEGPQYPDIQTIRDAIPAHCFVPSTWRSLGYVVRDVSMAAALGWAAFTYIPQLESFGWRTVAWMVYGYVQGLVCTGIWILAHEAGHGAFSVHRRLNDVVGWTLHSALLVPYFSWKFSHHRHHRFTGHMGKDMAFVPATKEDRKKRRLADLYLDRELLEDVPAVQLLKLLAHQLAGWQMYLLFNVSAGPDSQQRKASWWRVSHFEPTSAVFRPSEAVYVAITDVGLALVAALLYLASTVVGWKTVFLMYGVPYFWVHHWLIAITYLHHTHPEVHHFDAESWTFVKGALATVDRDFGFVGRHLFHGIIDTHVVHHLFPRIPFYKAEEATEAIKPLLGDLYHREERSFLGQLWSTFTRCKYVEADPAVPGALKWAE
ncbi:bifunctional D12/D15 fatty acid desaturase [Thermothelomyces thermophilus ATCC 42464]|uniref:Bifunctional D12/D15 fatty acid desaturase n=1 Tax=Thermothelomyces thermophilus (strain ATCC 42464 / BCRC 31852 / DSM 1799) TaxID=573729 RepID=G2QCM6_THET4|nr:bifunctional D12/D15 fatty acid desaturase [Thermothelomyces thermophilus ATCC 42464]AEO57349.1 bifunctional D12/D15 fatty acid desaturase [Thermothelomyces thermophilus ATCC 42464]